MMPKQAFIHHLRQPSEGWLLFYRVAAALLGGYALTLTSSMLLSQLLALLGMGRANASMTAMLLSFMIYAGIVIWFFTIDSIKSVWKKLLAALAITGGLVMLIKVILL